MCVTELVPRPLEQVFKFRRAYDVMPMLAYMKICNETTCNQFSKEAVPDHSCDKLYSWRDRELTYISRTTGITCLKLSTCA